MIIQGLLDFLSQAIAAIVALIPALPIEALTALSNFASMMTQFSNWLGVFDPIVPWDAISIAVSVWLIAVTVWGGMLAARFLFWVLGR